MLAWFRVTVFRGKHFIFFKETVVLLSKYLNISVITVCVWACALGFLSTNKRFHISLWFQKYKLCNPRNSRNLKKKISLNIWGLFCSPLVPLTACHICVVTTLSSGVYSWATVFNISSEATWDHCQSFLVLYAGSLSVSLSPSVLWVCLYINTCATTSVWVRLRNERREDATFPVSHRSSVAAPSLDLPPPAALPLGLISLVSRPWQQGNIYTDVQKQSISTFYY